MKLITKNQTVQLVTATKELVDNLLEMNTANRKLTLSHVRNIAAQIQAGEWNITTAAVGVDVNGTLTDGQHRLEAIKLSGYPPVKFMLMTGLSPESKKYTDTGKARSISENIAFTSGQKISSSITSIVNQLYEYQIFQDKNVKFGSKTENVKLTPKQFEKFINIYEDELQTVLKISPKIRAGVRAVMFVYYLQDKVKAERFIKQVSFGENIKISDPAYRLRKFLLENPGGGFEWTRKSIQFAAACAVADFNSKNTLKIHSIESWKDTPFVIEGTFKDVL